MKLDKNAEYAKFCKHTESVLGKSMKELERQGVWGLGKDEFAFECWMQAKTEAKEQK